MLFYLIRIALHKNQDWRCVPGFIVGVLGFSYHDWLLRRICLCDRPLKSSDIEDLSRFP